MSDEERDSVPNEELKAEEEGPPKRQIRWGFVFLLFVFLVLLALLVRTCGAFARPPVLPAAPSPAAPSAEPALKAPPAPPAVPAPKVP